MVVPIRIWQDYSQDVKYQVRKTYPIGDRLAGIASQGRKLKAIIEHTPSDNLASRKMMNKCGFELQNDVDGLLTYR